MLRALFCVSLAGLLAAPFLQSAALPPLPCPNTIVTEPLVVFAKVGPFLDPFGGPIVSTLTVYNTGLVQVTNANESGIDSLARVAQVTPALAEQLLVDMSSLGAGFTCDGPPSPIESPIHTLTVLRNATDGKSHTFSWRLSQGVYGPIHDRLISFVQTAFPSPVPGF